MQHDAPTPKLNGPVRAAWQTQMTAARQTPGLLPVLLRHRAALLPRFAATYTALRALPRRVRRALYRTGRVSLASVALWFVLGQGPIDAATIAVRGSCTLVRAIRAANTDRASGGCPAGRGADTLLLPVNSTHVLTQVDNSTYGPTGLPVISSPITIVGRGSGIQRASSAPEFRLLAVGSTGDLTLQETIVSGGAIVAGRDQYSRDGGGVFNFGGSLALAGTLVSGNMATIGPEIQHNNYFGGTGTVHTDNHNLFGVNGDADVEGFSPGPTDVVPPPGVALADILDPTLAANGGPTLTHALVPGSPALDAIPASDPGCTGTDQRGALRPQGVGCDIGAVEGGAPTVVNDQVTLVPRPTTFQTSATTSGCPPGFVGTFRFTAQLTAPAPSPPLVALVVEVETLSHGNLVQTRPDA